MTTINELAREFKARPWEVADSVDFTGSWDEELPTSFVATIRRTWAVETGKSPSPRYHAYISSSRQPQYGSATDWRSGQVFWDTITITDESGKIVSTLRVRSADFGWPHETALEENGWAIVAAEKDRWTLKAKK